MSLELAKLADRMSPLEVGLNKTASEVTLLNDRVQHISLAQVGNYGNLDQTDESERIAHLEERMGKIMKDFAIKAKTGGQGDFKKNSRQLKFMINYDSQLAFYFSAQDL